MSETLWGVFIGGGIVLAGNIIMGFFQKHQTKINIDARREEQSRQFLFEQQQKVINRSIEQMTKWIEPLRKSLTEYSIGANNTYLQIINIHYSIPESITDNPTPHASIKGRTSLISALDEWEKSSDQLSNIMAQISDQSLKHIISDIIHTHLIVSGAVAVVITRSLCVEFEQQLDETKDKTASAFKRMEDLLSGKE